MHGDYNIEENIRVIEGLYKDCIGSVWGYIRFRDISPPTIENQMNIK